MSNVKKFTFDLDFDAPEEPVVEEVEEIEEEEPEIVIPTFSEEELEQARAESFAAGKEEGRKEATDATEERLLESVEKAFEQLTEIHNSQIEANQDIAREMITISTAIAKKMFPDLNARNALGEVERVVQETLKAVTEEPRIQIMVNPELREPLTDRLGTMTHRAGFEGKVFVNPDPSIALGDCRIEWSNGAAVRDADELWEMIDKIIEHNLHGPEQDGGEAPDEAAPTNETAEKPIDGATPDVEPATPDAESAMPDNPETPVAPASDDLADDEALDAGKSPSWDEEIGESTDMNAAALSQAPEDAPSEGPDEEFNAPQDSNDSAPEEHSFTPSSVPEDEAAEDNNSQSDQEFTEGYGEPPTPHIDDLEMAEATPDDAGDGAEGASPPHAAPDPLSPATATAILDAQSIMNEDDDPNSSGQ